MKILFEGISWRLIAVITCICFTVGHVKAENTVYGYEYVDLGLPSGLLWATCNVGASSPEKYGDYFAWGGISDWYGSANAADADQYSVLPAELDAAVVEMNPTLFESSYGGDQMAKYVESWRMPTKDEFIELKNNTTITSETVNGVEGRRFTSKKNSNSIFIPFGGYYDAGEPKNVEVYANLWTASSYSSTQGCACWFKNSTGITTGGIDPNCQLPIRPVCPKIVKATGITLNYEEIYFQQHYCESYCYNTERHEEGGHMYCLKATLIPENATEQCVKFSSNGNLVSILSDETLLSNWIYIESLESTGASSVIVSTTDGTNLSATCTVTVYTDRLPTQTGKCGDNIQYTIEDNGYYVVPGYIHDYDIHVYGIGDMYDYACGTSPFSSIYESYSYWNDYPNPTGVSISEGISSIGKYAFANNEGIESIVLPKSIKRIESGAFQGCSFLYSISDLDKVEYIADDAFEGCNGLDIPIERIELTEKSLQLTVGESHSFDLAKIYPNYFPHSKYTDCEYLLVWNTSDETVLNVEDFTCQALSTGTADILVNGEKVCTVTVLAPKELDTDISQYSNIIFAQEQEMWGGEEDYISFYMNNEIDVNSFSLNLQLPEGFSPVLTSKGRPTIEWSGDREDEHVLSTSVLEDGSINIAAISMSGYTFSGNEGEIFRLKVKVPEDVDAELPLVINDIEMSGLDAVPYRVKKCVSTIVVKPYVLGDVNNDRVVTIADASGVVSMVLGTAPATLNRKAADVNHDTSISIADASGIVAMVINYKPSANAPLRDAESIDFSLSAGTMSMIEDSMAELPIMMNNAELGTALQFDITLPAGMALTGVTADEDHIAQFSRQSDGSYRIACLSLQNELFAEASVITLTLQDNGSVNGRVIKVSAIEVVDSKLNPCHPSDAFFTIDATGIETIGADMDTMSYDLFGRRDDAEHNGIRIIGEQKVLNR